MQEKTCSKQRSYLCFTLFLEHQEGTNWAKLWVNWDFAPTRLNQSVDVGRLLKSQLERHTVHSRISKTKHCIFHHVSTFWSPMRHTECPDVECITTAACASLWNGFWCSWCWKICRNQRLKKFWQTLKTSCFHWRNDIFFVSSYFRWSSVTKRRMVLSVVLHATRCHKMDPQIKFVQAMYLSFISMSWVLRLGDKIKMMRHVLYISRRPHATHSVGAVPRISALGITNWQGQEENDPLKQHTPTWVQR